MRKRITNGDYEAVFAYGGCFHFALRLNERFHYPIRGSRTDQGSWGHVWAKKNNDGIDIRGIYPETCSSALANGGISRHIEDISVADVKDAIRQKDFPSDLTDELFVLADKIVDTHERFEKAKPLKDAKLG
jgi:hypothetical protein